MSTQISPEAFAQAQAAAIKLKETLEKRLINQTSHGFSCGCGACSAGPSRVVGIHIPSSYRYQIAMWLLWTCEMQDDKGKRWSQGINRYIPWIELYPMFRNAFAGIDVQVDHPHAQMYEDKEDAHSGSRERNFVPSGQEIKVANNSSVIVCPSGDLSKSPWINAELRVDTNLERYTSEGQLIACNVDALELGQHQGRGEGHYYQCSSPASLSTFYIRIPGESHGQDHYLPIARVVRTDTDGVTFALDRSVTLLISHDQS